MGVLSVLLNSTVLMWILVFVFGLVVGSFLNVVGLRLLSGESIVFPPSKCPKCGKFLRRFQSMKDKKQYYWTCEDRNCKGFYPDKGGKPVMDGAESD